MNKQQDDEYSFKVHYGSMLICSLIFGFFSIAANFSSEGIIGAFIIGAICGEFVGVTFNWLITNSKNNQND